MYKYDYKKEARFNMPIEALKPLSNISGKEVNRTDSMNPDKNLFGDLLKNALNDINSSINLNDSQVEQILSGNYNDLEEYMVSLQKTEMTLDLTLQVRDKIIDAYKEIMRMQI